MRNLFAFVFVCLLFCVATSAQAQTRIAEAEVVANAQILGRRVELVEGEIEKVKTLCEDMQKENPTQKLPEECDLTEVNKEIAEIRGAGERHSGRLARLERMVTTLRKLQAEGAYATGKRLDEVEKIAREMWSEFPEVKGISKTVAEITAWRQVTDRHIKELALQGEAALKVVQAQSVKLEQFNERITRVEDRVSAIHRKVEGFAEKIRRKQDRINLAVGADFRYTKAGNGGYGARFDLEFPRRYCWPVLSLSGGSSDPTYYLSVRIMARCPLGAGFALDFGALFTPIFSGTNTNGVDPMAALGGLSLAIANRVILVAYGGYGKHSLNGVKDWGYVAEGALLFRY